MNTIQVSITGMSCQHCVANIATILEGLGLTNVSVDLAGGHATFSPSTLPRETIQKAIEDAGFDVVGFA